MLTITHKRGSSLDLPLQIFRDGVALDLSGRTCLYLVKSAIDDADEEAVLTLAQGDGLTVESVTQGRIRLTRTAAQMLLPPGKYYGFLQITGLGEVIEIPDQELSDLWIILKHGIQAVA